MFNNFASYFYVLLFSVFYLMTQFFLSNLFLQKGQKCVEKLVIILTFQRKQIGDIHKINDVKNSNSILI